MPMLRKFQKLSQRKFSKIQFWTSILFCCIFFKASELRFHSWLDDQTREMTPYVAHALTMGKLSKFQKMIAEINVPNLPAEKKVRLEHFCKKYGITIHCPVTLVSLFNPRTHRWVLG